MAGNNGGELKRVDRRVLQELQRDGHLSDDALGQKVGLSSSAANRHRRRLEEEGYIERYAAVVDAKRLGFAETVFVEIGLRTQDHDATIGFERAIAMVDEVMACYAVAGETDYLLQVVTRDAQDFERIRVRLSRLPSVEHAHSYFVLHDVVRHQTLPAT